MIQDGCPVRGDTSLNIRSNGQSLQGKFDIKMFKFIGDDLNDVWLHCTVRACEATTNEACLPDCGEDALRKKRSEKKKLNFISHDYQLLSDLPIQRKRDGEDDLEITERIIISQGSVTLFTPGKISFTVMMCVISLVIMLAIVFGITCMAVRRRRQTIKALTESNFSFHQ